MKSFLLMLLACTVLGAQTFTIINPYKGADGTGPYANWYGTTAHTHTSASGASQTASDIFASASALGLTLVPVNDKGGVTADPGSHSGMLYWPGYEETFSNSHILALGSTSFLGARTSDQDALQKIHATGGIAILAHPTFSSNSWNVNNTPGLSGFDGVEVVNGQGFMGFTVWDAALAKGRRVIGTGGNDLYAQGISQTMYINSPTNSYEDLVANFKAGNFYGAELCTSSAQGCTPGTPAAAIRVTQSGNTLTAAFQVSETNSTPMSNPSSITWYCGYPTAGSVCGSGTSYTVTGNEVYVRAAIGSEVYSPYNTWTNAIYVVPNTPKTNVTPTIRVSSGVKTR
jgi:hypothetical protein